MALAAACVDGAGAGAHFPHGRHSGRNPPIGEPKGHGLHCADLSCCIFFSRELSFGCFDDVHVGSSLVPSATPCLISASAQEQLPPKETSSIYLVSCPTCRQPCPLDSMPDVATILYAAKQSSSQGTRPRALDEPGEPEICSLGSDENLTLLRRVQERHRRLYNLQYSRGGIIGSKEPPASDLTAAIVVAAASDDDVPPSGSLEIPSALGRGRKGRGRGKGAGRGGGRGSLGPVPDKPHPRHQSNNCDAVRRDGKSLSHQSGVTATLDHGGWQGKQGVGEKDGVLLPIMPTDQSGRSMTAGGRGRGRHNPTQSSVGGTGTSSSEQLPSRA